MPPPAPPPPAPAPPPPGPDDDPPPRRQPTFLQSTLFIWLCAQEENPDSADREGSDRPPDADEPDVTGSHPFADQPKGEAEVAPPQPENGTADTPTDPSSSQRPR